MKHTWKCFVTQDLGRQKSLGRWNVRIQRFKDGRTAFTLKVTSCWDEDGTLLVQKDQVLQRWVWFFKQLLTKEQADQACTSIIPRRCDNIEPPDQEEVGDALCKLKTNQVPGIDGLPGELFKYVGEELEKILIVLEERSCRTPWKSSKYLGNSHG